MENKESNEIRKEKINKTVAKYEKKEDIPVKKTGIEQLEQMKARKNREDIFRPKFDDYDNRDSDDDVKEEKKPSNKNQSLKRDDNRKRNIGKTVSSKQDKDKNIMDRKGSNRQDRGKKNVDRKDGNRQDKEKKSIDRKGSNSQDKRKNSIDNKNSNKHNDEKNIVNKDKKNKIKKDDKKTYFGKNKVIKTQEAQKENNTEKSKLSNVDKNIKNNNENKNNITDISEVERLRKEREKRNKILKRQERKQELIDRLKGVNYKRVGVIISVAAVIIILSIVMSFTMIKTTIIDEGSNYTKQEIENMVIDGVMEHNSIYLFLKYRYSEQKKIPFIEYIDVSWVNATTVKIKVYDKKIIGCTNYMNQFLYFDKDGLVIETSIKRQKTIPYITGLNFAEVTLNNKIKVKDEEIFDTILAVTQQISKYKLDVDEISFDKNYNMTLYSGDITVLLGKKDAYDEQLAKLQNMLAEAKKKNLKGTLHMENYVEGQNRIIFNKKN